MTLHKIIPQTYHPTFGSHHPIQVLADGDTVEVNLLDAHGIGADGNRQVEFSNPLVGPFFIDGLQPGDALTVIVDNILPDRTQGWSYATPTSTTFDPVHITTMPLRKMISWTIEPSQGIARLTDPPAEIFGLQIPMNPMIGCLGVAPDKSQAITSYSSENFGGNMDCPLIVKGCRIELPVFVEGGLLFIGDLHAAQSQGEITGAGIEISGTAQFTIHIGKNKKIHWPRGENNHSIFCIGSGRPLDQAMQHATSEMVRYLGQDYGLSEENSCIVMSQAVEYMICNAVNENFTVCCYLEKSILINLIK